MDNSLPPYLERLNDRQREAVLAINGPVSVLAGAGSGKTAVLTTRTYHLIRKGIPAEKILAVTFTNKAAREMRERISRMLGVQEGRDRRPGAYGLPFIATFHGLGRELLETYGSIMGIPRHFCVYDRDDSKSAIRKALKELEVDPKEISPAAILARISKAKSEGMTLPEFREKFGRESFRTRIVAEAWTKYEETLKKEKALDFDDLIMLPVRLLERHEDVRELVQKRFTYLHIDEYQDTSVLQGRLVQLMAGEKQNLFVVADVDQAIYTWRNATIENLLSFSETYPGTKTIILEHNYRSTKTIVEAANQIIQINQNRNKDKRSVTNNPDGERITIHAAGNAEEEASWVAREVSRSSFPLEEVAILYRTNAQSRALEEAFLHAQIPYRLLGTRFFDRKEVKDVLAWARLVLEPDREADRIRAVQSPSRGIGKVTLGKITAGRIEELRPSDRAKVESFEKVVRELGDAAETLPPSAFLKLVIEKSGMETALLKEGEEGQDRLENIKELGALASRHDETPGRDGISAFLADSALASDQDEMDRPLEAKKKGVTLMTVHAAKGLEFDMVFVTGLEEGLFPHENMAEEERDEEEERRLFYVAVTRAKKRLVLTLARIRRVYGTDFFSEPSQFLRDIDPSLVSFLEADEYEDVIQI
ncbi:MAG TPA: UvrD-helicase domain-containing protein [Candidatus Paceibacterota bacterium]